MTDNSEQELKAPASAPEVDAQAMDFILQRHLDTWTENDQAEFDKWFSQSIAHKAAYWRLNSVWSRADRLSALRPLVPQRREAESTRRKGLFPKVAAALVVLAGAAGAAGYLMPASNVAVYETAVGGHKNLTLADGTRIELNTNTVLRADVNEKRRTVELVRGEALFHVKHDAAHPFVVIASQHRIIDLGTSFVVRESKDRVEVALLEGRARLESTDTQSPVKRVAILTPGDEAVATPERIFVRRKPTSEIHDELGWRRGILVFRSSTLAEVAAEYNRYNTQKIVITDDVAATRTMSATLPANDLGTFARIARNFLGLHVRETKDEIVISQ